MADQFLNKKSVLGLAERVAMAPPELVTIESHDYISQENCETADLGQFSVEINSHYCISLCIYSEHYGLLFGYGSVHHYNNNRIWVHGVVLNLTNAAESFDRESRLDGSIFRVVYSNSKIVYFNL